MPQAASATRGISPILFVLAILCFLLPFTAISCNSTAGASAAGALGSLGGTNTTPQESACLTQLSSGRDFITYSGVNEVTGGDPSTDLGACQSLPSSTPSSGGNGNIGVQPLLLVALIVIVAGAVATLLRAPLRLAVAAGAALVAGVLVIVNNSTVHGAIQNKLNSSNSGGSGSLSSLGITSIDTFFSIHAAIGFTLVLLALGLAFVVNVAGLALTLAPARGGGAAPPPPTWEPPPQAPPGAPPPSAPPP